jgi:hypothetical protein
MKTNVDVCILDGLQPGSIYELTYPARDPWVMGLGYAVTRDLASFLRFRGRDDEGRPNPLATEGMTGIRRVYGLGISSTGMYMREFLYLGFNEDEQHRKVFDAVRILIPGTHRLFANVEFSDPNVYSRQDEHSDYLSHSVAPLTYAVTTDPISGLRDGILKRPATDPLVFHIDTANEFWQMDGSLNVHDGRGKAVPAAWRRCRPRSTPAPTRSMAISVITRCSAPCWWRSTIGPTKASHPQRAVIPPSLPAR